ncbi:MAG: endonuclease [Xanthomonadaceae bacterium]|nr:endonuclease [Xanthomonadaceae bacterium]MDZ4115127.1 endonuclease [Xanthomonadaceae bacterium]MDZ4376555.1 endonuclease [Xanthomonadaceae bacterium]
MKQFPRLPRVIVAGLAIFGMSSASADVFINEFHYDNNGTDTNEKVEVIAPAGTSLSGWKVVLYNGSNGAQYATLNLSGTTANQCGGHGTAVVTVGSTGMQNGAPDGLALVDASGAVVQLLSYEGTFTASDGPAIGRTSSAVPTSETSTTTVGYSLQLSGSGSKASDFTWQTPRTSSFGACNAGQTLVAPVTGPVALSNGVAVSGLAATTNNALSFTLAVPSGASNLSFAINGGSGDADVYVRFGSAPTTSTYDCRPFLTGNAETCSFAAPQAGTWYVMVNAFTSFSGVSLTGNYTAASGGGGGGTGYYAGIVASSPSALRSALHNLIDDHTKIPYTASTTDTWDALKLADEDPLNSGRILDIYKNASYLKEAGGNSFYNREHTWPNSLGFSVDGSTNYAYTDMHMLMLSDITYNSNRGNKPYGDCSASCTEYATGAYASQGGGSGVFPGNSNWSDGVIWQVWSKLKGNVARGILYMDVRYEGGSNGVSGVAEPDLRLTDDLSLVVNTGGNAAVAYMGRLSTLLNWHQQDPVNTAEVLRNDMIQTFQGNRNPFIDHPEWVACVYQNVCN